MAIDYALRKEALEGNWREYGLCAQPQRFGYANFSEIADIFFSDDPENTGKAIAICETPCPSKAACLEFALVTKQRFGVFGGVDMEAHWKAEEEQAVQINPPATPTE